MAVSRTGDPFLEQGILSKGIMGLLDRALGGDVKQVVEPLLVRTMWLLLHLGVPFL